MKKIGLVVVATLFAFAACGKKTAVSEFGALFDNATKDITAISKDLEVAKDAPAVAVALNKMYDTTLALKTKGDALEKQYGKQIDGEMPAELKAKSDAFQAAMQNLFTGAVLEAIKKYGTSPEVMAALEKLKNLKN